MSYLLIDSPLTYYSTIEQVEEWIKYLTTLPYSTEKNRELKSAKAIQEFVLTKDKK